MIMKRVIVAAFAVTLLMSQASVVNALENLIGRVVEYTEFDTGELEDLSLDLAPAEIFVFDFNDYRFVDAVEIRAELPTQLRNRDDITFAALLYGELTDEPPRSGEITVRAERLHFQPMVGDGQVTIKLPVREGAPRVSRSRRVDTTPEPEAFPLALTFLPIGKGLPQDLPDHAISVTVRPVSRGVGELVLDVREGNEQRTGDDERVSTLADLGDYRLTVAGTARDSNSFFLEPGFHDVQLETPGYETFSATAAVEEGQTSRLRVELQPEPASVFLDAPRGTQVFVNGSIIGSRIGTSIELDPGEHELTFRIGGRSVTRMLQLEPGGSYTARVEFGVEVLENGETDGAGETGANGEPSADADIEDNGNR